MLKERAKRPCQKKKETEAEKESTSSDAEEQSTSAREAPTEPEKEKVAEELREEELLRDDVKLGGSPEGKLTNEALRALARASRSFLIYDTKNEAIEIFYVATEKRYVYSIRAI